MSRAGRDGSYKWTVLTNTTIGTLMATIDSSIVLISLPAIFRGIHMNPLTTSNTSYLLWMLMSYMVFALAMCLAAAASWLRGGAGARAAGEVSLAEPAAAAALSWNQAVDVREDA